MALLAGAVLLLISTSRSPQGPASPPAGAHVSRQAVATRGHNVPEAGQTPVRREVDVRAEGKASPQDSGGVDETRLAGGSNDEASLAGGSSTERLKSYEELWTNPDIAELRAAEQVLLEELESLPPTDLVALLGQGLSTRSANLVLITLENALRGPRRSAYEDALRLEIEAASEQPERLKLFSDIARRFNLSR